MITICPKTCLLSQFPAIAPNFSLNGFLVIYICFIKQRRSWIGFLRISSENFFRRIYQSLQNLRSMTLFNFFLIIHIVCGFTAFIVAPIAMAVKRAETLIVVGEKCFWAMCGVSFAALIMAPMHNNLFFDSCCSFLPLSGFLRIPCLVPEKSEELGSKIYRLVCGVFKRSILSCFDYHRHSKLPDAFGTISIVFGSIGLINSSRDLVSFIRPRNVKGKWFSVTWEEWSNLYRGGVGLFRS